MISEPVRGAFGDKSNNTGSTAARSLNPAPQGKAKRWVLATLVDRVFEVDRRVRFVGVYQEHNMLAGGMRKGRKSVDPEEEAIEIDIKMAKMGEITSAWQKWFGKLSGYSIRYKRVSLAFAPLSDDRFLVISTDSGLDPLDVMEKLRQDEDFGQLVEAVP